MKYIVSMMTGAEIECDNFEIHNQGLWVSLYRNKSWRENVGMFKKKSVVVEELQWFKTVKREDVHSIDAKA